MKIKKFLKKVAEEDRESLINDKDVGFLASIGVDYNKKKVATQNEPTASYYLTASAFNYRTVLICLVCFIVAAITVSIILYNYFNPALVDPPIHYFESNFEEVDSDLNELNADLELFSLAVDEDDYDLKIKKTYDSLSGDSLYYTLIFSQLNTLMKSFKFEIVVNSFYKHKQLIYDEHIETKIAEYTVKYTETYRPMSDTPFNTVICQGEIQIGKQWIYIKNYEEMTLGQSTFIETLQSIINFN